MNSAGSYGVWCVTGNAWVRSLFGWILRYDTLDEAEAIAAAQRLVYPEARWEPALIDRDGKPYKPDGFQ